MDREYLLIGGPCDGHTFAMRETATNLVIPGETIKHEYRDDGTMRVIRAKEIYRKMTIEGVDVLVYTDVTLGDAVSALVENYRMAHQQKRELQHG